MEIAVVVTLLLIGVILLLIEIFLIPGISIAGIGGVLFLVGSVVYAYMSMGATAGHLTVLGALILSGVSIWVFLKSRALDRISLKAEIDGKNDPLDGVNVKVGDLGVTVSRLAPMGKIRVNGKTIEAKTMDDFMDEATEVVVVKINSTNVLVERKKE